MLKVDEITQGDRFIGLWISVSCCVISIARKPNFIELNVVGAEFTNGAEFSRIYGIFIVFLNL